LLWVAQWNDETLYQAVNALKVTHPGLRTSIALGGWNFNAAWGMRDIFTTMAASPSSRATFIASAISFCRAHDFDGVDIDWCV
jgi:chitinase